MRYPILFLALCCGLCGTGAANAQVFKCKQGGTTVFSATPCGDDAEAIQVRPANVVGSVAPAAEQPSVSAPSEPAAPSLPPGAVATPSAPKAPACTNLSSTEVRKRVIEQTVFVGMRQADVIKSWGKPSRVNRNSYGKDQWVYDRGNTAQYVYIGPEGCVTAWN
ncbi:hypothetical protein [Ectopseudomonas hydrolytica]|uniref:hypothetical protein n=1 Tax=Ectopseudomonas hydrolytica TaxID=2493633 RepID=UPI00376EE0D6